MTAHPLWIMAVLAACVALSEWLDRHTPLHHLGASLLVILVTAVAANLGAIPTAGAPVAVYDAVFSVVAPASIFLLLLQVRLVSLRRAGGTMVVLFALGALGTFAGVTAAFPLLAGVSDDVDLQRSVGGMFVATYTGGSLNFNAVALERGVAREGAFYVGSVAVDSIMTAVWMVVTIGLPRLLGPRWPARGGSQDGAVPGRERADDDVDLEQPESLRAGDLAATLAVVLVGLVATELIHGRMVAAGLSFPRTLVLTALALALAQVPGVSRLAGPRVLGMLGVLLFLAVIGAACDLHALGTLGAIGPRLFLFTTVVIAVHGLVLFGGAALLRFDVAAAAVASQANVGGGSTALALARGLGRPGLALPGVLVGSLGTASGNFLGLLACEVLG